MVAGDFATIWIQDWNTHDLEAVMSHYSDQVDFTSPFIKLMGINAEGKINNKAALQEYFARALIKYPDLHFELYHELKGLHSVVLFYKSVHGLLSAEFMEFDQAGKIVCVKAHYNSTTK